MLALTRYAQRTATRLGQAVCASTTDICGVRAAQGMGYSFTAQTLTALMLVAPLPSASNVSMRAERERFGVDSERSARIILVSTALSFFTFSKMVWLLGVQLPGA